MTYDSKLGAQVPETLSELYAMAEHAVPFPQLNFKDKIKNFFTHRSDKYVEHLRDDYRSNIYNSLSPEQQEAIYLNYMLDSNSDEYEGFVGNGYTPEQYEMFVRSNPRAREMFYEHYGI